jgi:hypothetical protein
MSRGPLTGGAVGAGFWALIGAVAGALVASGLLVRQLPSDSRVVTLIVTVLPAYGAFIGYLLHRFRGTDPSVGAVRNRVLVGCVLGFVVAAGGNAWGLLARAIVPFGVVAGGGIALALAHRANRS